ncbi:FMN-binding negative transcriptional regulator [Pedococcus sp. NPDC057267]|uniref:FMN-binding negative transcriptional regulator n=1 Tax=Pedococcus sp. NPDC057267 TaxID=3346077 RepID=UPI0036430F57
MRHTPRYLMTDPQEVKRVIRANPWATFVSPAAGGLVASHYPAILDDTATQGDDITILSHFGRPDDELHELGQHQVLIIIQGPHDYVSPSWYAPGDLVPTWNHVTAHLYGTPHVLSEEENYNALSMLTDHFEQHMPQGRSLSEDDAGTRRAANGTVGLRVKVDRFEARAKLSQNKTPDVIENVTAHIAEHNPALADEMRRVHGNSSAEGQAHRLDVG